jgi:hypothetical protein
MTPIRSKKRACSEVSDAGPTIAAPPGVRFPPFGSLGRTPAHRAAIVLRRSVPFEWFFDEVGDVDDEASDGNHVGTVGIGFAWGGVDRG